MCWHCSVVTMNSAFIIYNNTSFIHVEETFGVRNNCGDCQCQKRIFKKKNLILTVNSDWSPCRTLFSFQWQKWIVWVNTTVTYTQQKQSRKWMLQIYFPFFFPSANPAAWTNREAEPVAVMPTVQIVAAATPTASGLTDRVDLLQTKHRYSVYYWYTSSEGKG